MFVYIHYYRLEQERIRRKKLITSYCHQILSCLLFSSRNGIATNRTRHDHADATVSDFIFFSIVRSFNDRFYRSFVCSKGIVIFFLIFYLFLQCNPNSYRPCGECSGQGYNAKTKNERKVVEVHVEKGAANNQKITFRGMADEVPGRETGDVNFIIQEKEHDLFKRKGADLLIMQDISLNQALTGFSVSSDFYYTTIHIIIPMQYLLMTWMRDKLLRLLFICWNMIPRGFSLFVFLFSPRFI